MSHHILSDEGQAQGRGSNTDIVPRSCCLIMFSVTPKDHRRTGHTASGWPWSWWVWLGEKKRPCCRLGAELGTTAYLCRNFIDLLAHSLSYIMFWACAGTVLYAGDTDKGEHNRSYHGTSVFTMWWDHFLVFFSIVVIFQKWADIET